jgi:predicted metalloprotease with PDZ domain
VDPGLVFQLSWEKINKNSWRVKTNGVLEWHVTYRVYANELTVRTSELNSDHAFWNNATLLMYLQGFLNVPATLKILAPQPWKIATGLPTRSRRTKCFSCCEF